MSVRPFALNATEPSGVDVRIGPMIEAGLEHHYRLALVVLGDAAAAEDATHDAVARALASADQLRDASRFEAWFRRILVNACRDVQRSGTRRPTRSLTAEDEDRASDDPNVRWVERDAMADAVDRLSFEHREVIVMRYYLDLPTAAIGEALGISHGTVRSRLHYALRRLRAEVDAAARDGRGER